MRNFTNRAQSQASALLAQGGLDDDAVREFLPAVASAYRENDKLSVKAAVQFVADAVSVPGSAPDATTGKPAKRAAKATKASKAQKQSSRKAAPRRNCRDLMIFTALENDWTMTTHKLGSQAEQDIRILNPHRGTRDWAATFTKANATFHLSTIQNPNGGVHPDGCWLFQGGETKLVGYLYEIIATLSTPFTKDGFAVVPPKEQAKEVLAKVRGTAAVPEKASA